jgi:hypothetical protein
MRNLKQNNLAQAGMVGLAVGILITIIIGVMIYFSIAGSLDTTTIDTKMGGTYNATSGVWSGPHPLTNATNSANAQANTFFTIAPIVAVAIVAVVVIGYVNRIGG